MSEPVDPNTGEINYDLAIHLDAEDLAEGSLGATYRDEVGPRMAELGVPPRVIDERCADVASSYSVDFEGTQYPIYGPDSPAVNSWGLAAYALFDIVNRQLTHLNSTFFALDGGNELSGIFMSPAQAELARRSLPSKQDWPYIPTAQPEWFGAYHD